MKNEPKTRSKDPLMTPLPTMKNLNDFLTKLYRPGLLSCFFSGGGTIFAGTWGGSELEGWVEPPLQAAAENENGFLPL